MKKTIIDLFEASVRKYGAKTFLLEKRHHKFEPTTYAETREQALEAGAGLAALGIRPGDKVAILAEGSNAWIISECGTPRSRPFSCRNTSCPRSAASAPDCRSWSR